MKRQPSSASQKAFTLLELLLVAVVVAILAALLLPVLSKAKGRAKQIECLSQLKQIGLAAQQFTHDHGGRFPFQVPVKDGGTLELVQAASGLGDVQYAFRHFQTLSNDLEVPKLLACPSDRRIVTNAVTFSSLRNEHISYFMAVTAEYSRPDSLLAGDRNIIARGGNSGAILRIAADTEVAWTSECHEYKGNLLFAGGHVERTGNAGLKVAMQSPTGPVDTWMPTLSGNPSPGTGSPSAGGGSSASSSGGSGGTGGGVSGGGRPGGGGSGKSGGGGASSGFAALEKFFQTPQGPRETAPSPPPAPPPKPVYSGGPEAPIVEQPPTVAALPEPKPRTNQIAAAPPAPTFALPPAEEEKAWMPEPPAPGPLAIFVEPERCWWCWVVFLTVSFVIAVTLGVLIQRRRQERLRAATAADDSPR